MANDIEDLTRGDSEGTEGKEKCEGCGGLVHEGELEGFGAGPNGGERICRKCWESRDKEAMVEHGIAAKIPTPFILGGGSVRGSEANSGDAVGPIGPGAEGLLQNGAKKPGGKGSSDV